MYVIRPLALSNPFWPFILRCLHPLPLLQIKVMADIWDYLRFTFLPGIREHAWYNNDPPKKRAGFIADRVSKLIGYPTIRQLRVKTGRFMVMS